MNELDVMKFLEENNYKAFVMVYKLDGVRELKFWSRDNSRSKTMTYDPRWDSERKEEPS